MTHDQWGAVFRRMELSWGSISAPRREHYFGILGDLDGAAVSAAVDRLAREPRESVPPPGVIRDYALRAGPAGPPPPAVPEVPAPTVPPQPVVATPPPAQPAAPPPSAVRRSSGKALAALVLGIAGVIFGWLLLIAPILAIIFGAVALSEMKDDPELTGRGQAQWGLGLGIVALAGWVVLFIVAAAVGDGG